MLYFYVHPQERQRQGILGIHMDSVDEHLDQQELQKLLGKVIQGTSACLDGPAPDHQVLAAVVLSRQVAFYLCLVAYSCPLIANVNIESLQASSLHVASCL